MYYHNVINFSRIFLLLTLYVFGVYILSTFQYVLPVKNCIL